MTAMHRDPQPSTHLEEIVLAGVALIVLTSVLLA
jgi:hypothetical protein